jgi:uncharacterized protein (UPF0332 family)
VNFKKIYSNKEFLNKQIDLLLKQNQIKKINENHELVISHILKAKHNLTFFKLNKEHNEFYDWLIVTLYYALYHSALALIVNKKYSSKNHTATILILIKEYSISESEAELINELSINKTDAELYTNLKQDRHNASYSTQTKFSKEDIENYQIKVITFINKAEEIINND